MNVRILTSAFNDLVAGREFYERQGEGVGAYFFDSLFSEIDSLSIFGGIHREIKGFHRLLARRFPYAIYYKMASDSSIVVYRVLDCRQDPEKIKRELKSSE
jgi:plasmid stabilization system protein ParE